MPVLEDKIVQRAMVEVLNAIYEQDFVGFSYGFRPGRDQHRALDAVTVGLTRKKVNWVLDADIRAFFDSLNHEWLVRFVEHRIADRRIVRLIHGWLRAGVLEDGVVTESEEGTVQGGSISPLLANIYLHYVLDLWVERWRKGATGDVIVVRYADDFVMGFQYRHEAKQFLADLRERLAKFGLELHPEKTRLIEFGRYAAENHERRGDGSPPTFDFLGFTHACGRTRAGKFKVLRQTIAKRMRAKLTEIGATLKARRHWKPSEIGKWLRTVVNGYFNYHAIPDNSRKMSAFRFEIGRLWRIAMRRRSQKDRTGWARIRRLVERWLPPVRVRHPWPWERLIVKRAVAGAT